MGESILVAIPIGVIASLFLVFLISNTSIISLTNQAETAVPKPKDISDDPIIEQPVPHNISALEEYRFSKRFSTVPLAPIDGKLGPALPGITLDNNGHAFVTDSSNNRIVKFDTNGNFIKSWGSFGYSIYPYGFNIPMDLDADSRGNIHVVDMQGHKIKVYDNDGNFIKYFGKLVPPDCYDENGDTRGAFCDSKFSHQPLGIAVLEENGVADSGNGSNRFIVVVDYKIKVFTEDGEFVRAWGENGTDHNLGIPEDVAIDSDGNVYSIQLDKRNIQKFSSNGTFLDEWHIKGGQLDNSLSSVTGIDVDERHGIVYVAATTSVQKFDTNGSFLGKWNVSATKIVVSQDGSEIYTIGYWPEKYRIHVYDKNGNLLREWGESIEDSNRGHVIPMLPALPSEVAVDDKEGSIYVRHDKYNANFNGTLKFDQNGNFISLVDAKEEGEVFKAPTDSEGNTYLVDDHRIKKISEDGRLLRQWGGECTLYDYPVARHHSLPPEFVSAGEGCIDPDGLGGPLQLGDGQFLDPSSIIVDSKDYVYVLDGLNDRTQKFDQNGKFISKVGIINGSREARSLAIDKYDNIYIAKSGDSYPLIQKFNSNLTLLAAWGSYCDPGFETGCIDPDGESGAFLLGHGQLHGIRGIDVDSDGSHVYLIESVAGTQNSVVIFEKTS